MEEIKTKQTSYKQCPSCGAVMRFEPKNHCLKCDYCDSNKKLDLDRFARRREYNEDTELYFENWGEIKHFRCSSCGAVSVLPDFEMSPECPFCNSGNLICEEDIKGLSPTGILPFKINKEDAGLKYKDFIKSKYLAPSKLRKNFKVASIKGIYIPTFCFTSDTFSSYSGRLGKYYYVTVGSGKNRHTVRKTRYYNVSGSKDMSFENLQYEVSSHIDQKNLYKLGFYDVENALEYENSYLAGFSSERYTESLDKTWTRAQNDMREKIKGSILSEYNADVVDYINIDTAFSNKRYQYLLVPVWKCSYDYKQKKYDFFINGRNGKAAGKAPYSPLKIAFLALSIFMAVAALIYIFATNYH